MKRRRSTSAPSYRLHKATGQARVRINGKDHYLGTHGTPESHQRYRQVIADKWHPPGTTPKPVAVSSDAAISVSRLAIEYGKHVNRKHGDESSEWKQVRMVLKTIRETYGHLEAEEFGPVNVPQVVPHTTTHNHVVPHGNHVDLVPHTTTHFDIHR